MTSGPVAAASGREQPPSVGTGAHSLVVAYDTYLDAMYDRAALVAELAGHLRRSQVETVLDCAAGTGFPAVDLKTLGYTVHCTDSSPAMIEVLRKNAVARGVTDADLEPRLRTSRADPMVLAWRELDEIVDTYDWVMCRGNSLVYDSTWDGSTEVATAEQVKADLDAIGRRVKVGGHLLIDGPGALRPGPAPAPAGSPEPTRPAEVDAEMEVEVDETVEVQSRRRRWDVAVWRAGRLLGRAELHSARLSIDDLAGMLDHSRFAAERVCFRHERASFGVIRARRIA